MKKFILMLAVLPLAAVSQNTSGKVIYHQKREMNIQLDYPGLTEEQKKRIKKRMEAAGNVKKVLLFNSTESLYRDYDTEQDGEEMEYTSEDGNLHMRMVMMRAEEKVYTQLADQKSIEQREIMGKKFIIKDEREKAKWKLTGKQDSIAGFVCQQATWQKNDTVKITAWFTPQIPVAGGPDGLGGLPGLILKTDINDGKVVLTASEIDFRLLKDGEIEVPKKGKEVTREEFQKIAREKREEQREMYGGGQGGRHIHISHD